MGALLVRGSTPQGKFHLQVTASADPLGNSDDLLYAMIPDMDLVDAMLANQTADDRGVLARRVTASGRSGQRASRTRRGGGST